MYFFTKYFSSPDAEARKKAQDDLRKTNIELYAKRSELTLSNLEHNRTTISAFSVDTTESGGSYTFFGEQCAASGISNIGVKKMCFKGALVEPRFCVVQVQIPLRIQFHGFFLFYLLCGTPDLFCLICSYDMISVDCPIYEVQ